MEAELIKINSLGQKDKASMTIPQTDPRLERANRAPPHPAHLTTWSLTQAPAYSALLQTIVTGPEPELSSSLSAWLDGVLGSPQLVARQALTEFTAQLNQITDREARKDSLSLSLAKLQPRVTSFEEQVCALGEAYADLLEADEEYPEAAKALIALPLESSARSFSHSPESRQAWSTLLWLTGWLILFRSTESKLFTYIRIVRLFLQEEDSTSAETYFNRASLLIHTTNDPTTQVLYKTCQAQMFDFGRRFAEAAQKYHELSYVASVDEEDRLVAL